MADEVQEDTLAATGNVATQPDSDAKDDVSQVSQPEPQAADDAAVWDSFHANGIEIAFPQRDLHIKSAVPLKIFKDNAQPEAKDSLEVTGHSEKLPE
jgi:hypothetical protein